VLNYLQNLPAAAQREIVPYQFTRAFPLALHKDCHILLTLKEMRGTPRKMQVYTPDSRVIYRPRLLL
jgi:hypothetical protein